MDFPLIGLPTGLIVEHYWLKKNNQKPTRFRKRNLERKQRQNKERVSSKGQTENVTRLLQQQGWIFIWKTCFCKVMVAWDSPTPRGPQGTRDDPADPSFFCSPPTCAKRSQANTGYWNFTIFKAALSKANYFHFQGSKLLAAENKKSELSLLAWIFFMGLPKSWVFSIQFWLTSCSLPAFCWFFFADKHH